MFVDEKKQGEAAVDEIGQILSGAARYMRECGWCRGKMADEHGRVCALGAITRAMLGLDHLSYTESRRAYHAAVKRLRKQLPDSMPMGWTVAQWNDGVAKSADEVIAKLEEAARS